MSDVLPTCPYCNAQLPAGAEGRVLCPRCGETVSLTRRPSTIQERPDSPWAPPPISFVTEAPTAATSHAANPKRANRIVAGIVLGVMTLMATTGLIYALVTVHVRREHDRELPPKMRKAFDIFRKKETQPSEPVAPALLAGLGYLPPGTNVVAGVHVEELLARPAGKELRGQGITIGGVALRLDSVKERIGLSANEIDHLLLGVQMREDKDLEWTPPAYLVVRTRKPYDGDSVKKALRASRPHDLPAPEGGKRSVYSAKIQDVPLLLWLADEQTFVLGLFTKMEDVPLTPQEGASQLPSELRQVLDQRLRAGVPVWLAGHSANWEQTLLPKLLSRWKTVPVLSRFRDVRTFDIALEQGKPVRLIGSFRCADEASARRIEQDELAPREKAEPKGFKFSRDNDWLNVQMALDLGGSSSREK
jgi:hypothetical protein